MAMSDAERQRAYRQRQLKEGTADRINMVVSAHAKAALARLARHRGETQRATLEAIISEAEGNTVEALDAQGRRRYFDDE
ncbi:RepB family protein [Arhodomonas sp. SL1]|uniref:RepB family protein n=1 Tax=Arhodomonas sp. SL1 TaxID=3425691 RepID=UPI003F884003